VDRRQRAERGRAHGRYGTTVSTTKTLTFARLIALRSLLLCLVTVGLLPSAVASETIEQRGRALADACAACHGPDGRSTGAIPPLTATTTQALRDSLRAFRDGTRTGTVMNRLMQGLTDTDIDAIAGHFVTPPRTPGQR
jgi:cytochrome c553